EDRPDHTRPRQMEPRRVGRRRSVRQRRGDHVDPRWDEDRTSRRGYDRALNRSSVITQAVALRPKWLILDVDHLVGTPGTGGERQGEAHGGEEATRAR